MNEDLPGYRDFYNYVQSLPLSSEIKEVICKDESISKNPLFYLQYVSLFENNFDFENKEKNTRLLNVAGYLCYKYSLLVDNLLDSNEKGKSLALSNIYLEETVKILTTLFGQDFCFWEKWNERKKEFYTASFTGKSLFEKSNVSISDYENLCDHKSAMGKIALDSLFILDEKKNRAIYERLVESHKYFSVGFQINDDIEDFIQDTTNKDFNFAYYTFSRENSLTGYSLADQNKLLYIEGTAGKLYSLSLAYFRKAKFIAEELKAEKWIEAIDGKINETESALNAIDEYMNIIQTRISLNEAPRKENLCSYHFDSATTIGKGLNYLVDEWNKNLPEIKHIMMLGEKEGFKNKSSIHVTDIFQRAILTNNLIDISADSGIDLSQIINSEVEYLMNNRLGDETGAWSYFPTVKEIAPDADDLGQIIQVFIRSGNNKMISFCNRSIDILLNDCLLPDGGIQTWIIPKKNRTALQKIQYDFNESKWGSGPDVDVMANFLYALLLINSQEHKTVIEKGMDYIYTKIENSSCWNPRWYYGWLYPTMISVRLTKALVKSNPESESKFTGHLLNIMNQILVSQNNDGGWSERMNVKSDALNTAFGLITLSFFDTDKDIYNRISAGINFLKTSQRIDGTWPAVNFIKPRINEPYKSKTITTSYALAALSHYDNVGI